MQYAEVELLLDREMPHTGHKRLPERAIIRPFGKDFVDSRVMNHRFAQFIAVCSSSILAETLATLYRFQAHDVENGAV